MTTEASLDAFMAWKTSAQPGQRYRYHRGFLALDIAPESRSANSLSPARQAVSAAYQTGVFDLVQERHGVGDYSYYIIRRTVRDTKHRPWLVDDRNFQTTFHYQRRAGVPA